MAKSARPRRRRSDLTTLTGRMVHRHRRMPMESRQISMEILWSCLPESRTSRATRMTDPRAASSRTTSSSAWTSSVRPFSHAVCLSSRACTAPCRWCARAGRRRPFAIERCRAAGAGAARAVDGGTVVTARRAGVAAARGNTSRLAAGGSDAARRRLSGSCAGSCTAAGCCPCARAPSARAPLCDPCDVLSVGIGGPPRPSGVGHAAGGKAGRMLSAPPTPSAVTMLAHPYIRR